MSEIFDLIARYAERQGWIPIGWREFPIGPWDVTVNGTTAERDHVPPYHARIVHRDIIAIMVLSPFGGSIGGWQGAEDAFIVAIQAELNPEAEGVTHG